MKTTKPLSRKSPLRRSQPKRDWSAAREKVELEAQCRVWIHNLDGTGCEGKLEAAHVIGRECDFRPPLRLEVDGTYMTPSLWAGKSPTVHPDRIVPLCTKHHRAYDAHEIDLLPVLTLDEQVQAVIDADGLENARRRLCPSAYR